MIASQIHAVVLESSDPRRAAEFWGALLNRPPIRENPGVSLAGTPRQVGLRFVSEDSGGGRDLLHLHLITDGTRNQDDIVATCIELGASHIDVGQKPEEPHVVLADAVGEAFCVIEDSNRYLAGCGPLAEVTCVGTRTVGIFWSEVLQWPLVWEEGEETAIQSPFGGTKLAWSGHPGAAEADTCRQFFELTTSRSQLDRETSRLLGLGAIYRGTGENGEEVFGDPDGTKFVLRTR
ncbi:MAG: VOC family protein [Cryobacterium sp.]|nr:VOC family protein [Cryobacterium sp.]